MTTPSWQPDPLHRHDYRWWDSQHWTEHVSDHGVAGIDPLYTSTEPPHATWAAPTVAPPARVITASLSATPQPPATPSTPKRRGLLIGAAVVVVAALGIGGFLLLGGKDDTPTLGQSTADPTGLVSTSAAASTEVPTTVTTAAPTTTVATTIPPSTLPPLTDDEQLRNAMPAMYVVPTDWVSTGDTSSGHEPTNDNGTCNGPNNTALALQFGSTAQVDGPTYDLPSGASFGIEGLSFAAAADASAFLAASASQASGCTTAPVVTQVSEAELTVFADPTDATWQLDTYASAAAETAGLADEVLVVSDSIYYSTSLADGTYSFMDTWQRRLERYGRHVIEYWTYGEHDFVGFNNGAPDWAYSPTPNETADAAAVVRDHIRGRLIA
jgi:hypothetical protein